MRSLASEIASSVAWTPERFLAVLGAEFSSSAQVRFEFSIRLSQQGVEDRGRFACWVIGDDSGDFDRLIRTLGRLDAPQSVVRSLRNCQRPVRRGLAVSFSEAGPEFRLYIHGQHPVTLSDEYEGWRWTSGGPPRLSRYSFHYFPETPTGQRPIDFIPAALRPSAGLILAEPRLRQASGFWLRTNKEGKVEQLDLTFPWSPRADTVTGLNELAGQLEVPDDQRSRWCDLPVRHVAFRLGAESPSITLYSSAMREGPWPATEIELQDLVRSGALDSQRSIREKIDSRVPELPASPDHSENDELGRFYDGNIPTWKSILGPEMHYHHGLFDGLGCEDDDEAMDVALRRAVTELYQFIPSEGRLYDIGCGWGGPLSMLTRDLKCPSLGLTISRSQFRYVAGLGLPVRLGDAERTFPPGQFDCVLMLESLTHIRDKVRLLSVLRPFARRLIMRVNCQDSAPEGTAFGGTMHMISSTRLREILKSSGWRIQHWKDRRREALPSVAVWWRRIQSLPTSNEEHLEVFRTWCDRLMRDLDRWGRHNPLIEVVAD